MSNISHLEDSFPEYSMHTDKNISFVLSQFSFFPLSFLPLFLAVLSPFYFGLLYFYPFWFYLTFFSIEKIYRQPPLLLLPPPFAFSYCFRHRYLSFVSITTIYLLPLFYSLPFSRLWPTQ